MDLSSLENFLILEKACENSENPLNLSIFNVKEIAHQKSAEPLRGSFEYIRNLLQPNSDVCNLNDTLEIVEYMLSQDQKKDRERKEEDNNMSIITISSNESETCDLELHQKLEEISQPNFFFSAIDLEAIKSPKTPQNQNQMYIYNDLRKTG